MRPQFLLLPLTLLLLGAACSKAACSKQPAVTVNAPAPCSQFTVIPQETNSAMRYTYPGKLADEKILGKQVRITTAKGDIVFELLPGDAPCTVSNFVYLTEAGYYDGLTFHRVEKSPEPFVIQGGDPSGNGSGGPGYEFADESVTRNYDRGIVAMANAGPDTNGSQFFIMLGDNATLPKKYAIFGRVTAGMDVVDQIQVGDRMTKVTVEPLEAL